MQLKLSLLGSFSAILDGKAIQAFESDKVRALLAYLAVEADRPHRREALTGLLWPEKPELTARHNLNQAIYNLRHALGERDLAASNLLTTPETVQFCPSEATWLDVNEFKRLLESCGQHSHGVHAPCSKCKTRLEQAAALYRGEFLADLSLKDNLVFEEWVVVTREQLHLQMQYVLQRLATACEQFAEHDQALAVAWRMVEMNPLWEDGVRQLMSLLERQGQRNAALAQYDRLQRDLQQELGVEPEQETHILADRLRREAVHQPVANNLPAFLTPFVGRQVELTELQKNLRDPHCRLFTLLGPGGSGKTRLAIETARTLLEDFPDGVYLVLLNPLQSTEALPAALAEALGFLMQPTTEPKSQLFNYLRLKQVLLVMDGYESLPEGAGFAAELLRAAPGCKILATSRARLNVKGENVFPLEGLDFPRGDMQQPVTGYSAVQLFLAAARRVNPGVELEIIDLSAVAEICQLTQGMPLGVLLASAWIGIYSPQEITTEIRSSLDFLSAEWRDAPPRQRSLRASFEYSWGLLDGRERRLLAGLSVFRAGFTRQAAHEVAGAASHELLALVDKSLLQRSLDGRYHLHELVRQFAGEKLREEPGAEQEIRARHCDFFVQALQRWEADLKSARQGTALLEQDTEHENFRLAWNWAAENREVARLEQSLEGLCLYDDLRARLAEGESACRQAVESLATAEPVERTRLLISRILTWQARFQRQMGDLPAARKLLDESLSLVDQTQAIGVDGCREQAFAQLEMGNLVLLHDHTAAGEHYRLSLALYRELELEWEIAQVLTQLGWLGEKIAQYATSKEYCAEAVAILQRLGEPRTLASALDGWGFACIRHGELAEGEKLVRQAVSVRQQTGDRLGAAYACERLGTILVWMGRSDESHALMADSLAIYRELGVRERQPFVIVLLSIAETYSGDYTTGETTAREALALARELGQ